MKTITHLFSVTILQFTLVYGTFATTFSVTTTVDNTGAGTLRTAITNANADLTATAGAPHLINFTGAGIGQINLLTPLPSISNHIDIDGGTVGTVIIDAGNTGVIPQAFLIDNAISNGSRIQRLVINNAGVGPGVYIKSPATNVTVTNCRIGTNAAGTAGIRTIIGIQIDGAANGNHTISNNLISGTITDALLLSNTTNNTITGNWIGLEVTGTNALAVGNGLNLINNSNYNTISNNVVSASNGAGILLTRSSYNTITGNYCGTDKTGLLPRGNAWDAIGLVDGSNFNRIGGTTLASRNVCCAGTSGIASAIAIKSGGGAGLTSSNNVVLNNYCGVGADGVTALGNNNFGIYLGYLNASSNIIGKPGFGNVVAYNTNGGIVLENAGTLNNSIRGNSTFCNGTGGGLASNNVGISLRSSSNASVVAPTINSGSYTTNVFGSGLAAGDTVDLYYTDACRGCTYPNGKTYIGFAIANASGNWSYTGGVSSATSVTVTVTKYNATSIPGHTSEFSTCTVGLPVSLLSFSATPKGEGVLVQWNTTLEINNDYFVVQRSTDGIHFSSIGTVEGNGNATSINDYSFFDIEAPVGNVYYRLLQFDFDGTATASKVVAVTISSSYSISVYPSPLVSGNSLTVYAQGNGDKNSEFKVIDAVGKVIIEHIDKGSLISLPTNNLTSGMYTLIVTSAEEVSKTIKFVVQ